MCYRRWKVIIYKETLRKYGELVERWMDFKAGKEQENMITDLFTGGVDGTHKSRKQTLLEEKFRNENFELVVWFVVG